MRLVWPARNATLQPRKQPSSDIAVDLTQFLHPACSQSHVSVGSRKKALEVASEVLARQHAPLDAGQTFDALVARERLGSTALGEGVALPHCRSALCTEPVAAILQLSEAVDFEAPDRQPVDLVFALVVPEEADNLHLQILSAMATAFNQPAYRARARAADSDQALYEAIVQLPDSPGSRQAAARR